MTFVENENIEVKEIKKYISNFIKTEEPSFWTGVLSLTGFGKRNIEYTYDPSKAAKIDYDAISSDWAIVGDDINKAINQHKS